MSPPSHSWQPRPASAALWTASLATAGGLGGFVMLPAPERIFEDMADPGMTRPQSHLLTLLAVRGRCRFPAPCVAARRSLSLPPSGPNR